MNGRAASGPTPPDEPQVPPTSGRTALRTSAHAQLSFLPA